MLLDAEAVALIGKQVGKRRYAHLAADHLATYAERRSALRAIEKADDTKTAQA